MFRQLLRLFRKENGDQGETRPRQKEADLLSSKKGGMKLFWRRHGFGRNASCQQVISKQEKCIKKLEELKFEIQKYKFERDELSQMLDLYIYDDWDYRLDVELPILQSEHEMRMTAVHTMTTSISDAKEKYKELIQENNSLRTRHSQLLREHTQLKNNIRILQNENRKLLMEQTELPASYEEEKRFREEARMNICVPRAKQQQNKEELEERMQDTLKQTELTTQESNLGETMQKHSDIFEIRSEILQLNLEHGTDQDKVSLGEKCYRRRTKCAQQIPHYCISSLISIATVGCISLL